MRTRRKLWKSTDATELPEDNVTLSFRRQSQHANHIESNNMLKTEAYRLHNCHRGFRTFSRTTIQATEGDCKRQRGHCFKEIRQMSQRLSVQNYKHCISYRSRKFKRKTDHRQMQVLTKQRQQAASESLHETIYDIDAIALLMNGCFTSRTPAPLQRSKLLAVPIRRKQPTSKKSRSPECFNLWNYSKLPLHLAHKCGMTRLQLAPFSGHRVDQCRAERRI